MINLKLGGGAFIFSAPMVESGGKSTPENFHMNMGSNVFNYIGMMEKSYCKKAVFSITITDDAKEVYFDMENCEVFPLGYVDKLLEDGEKHKRSNKFLCAVIFVITVVSAVLSVAYVS